MMDFEEFKNRVADVIIDYLPSEYANASVRLREVTKNNDQHLTGLSVCTEESSIAPNIYLDQYFAQYEQGRDIENILQEIADVRESMEIAGEVDMGFLADLDKVRDRIFCKLVNAETNGEYLSNKPHVQMEDLAVVYAVHIADTTLGRGSVTITEDMMKSYGLTAGELHEIAAHNLSESAIEFKSLRDVIMEEMFPDGIPADDPMAAILLPNDEPMPMYVLSNAERLNGAAAVLDSGTMESIAEKLGGDYVVIPSSIHEVIIMPLTGDTDRNEIEQIIRNVNAGQVAPEDRLSDHAYQYDSKSHELVRMDKMEERQAQRSAERKGAAHDAETERKPESRRVSVKARLAEKKAEAAEKEAGREKPALKQERNAAQRE